MRVGASPEGLFERLALTLNLAPKPLVDTQVAFNAARAIMSAAKLGIFEALGRGQKRAVEVAESCATDPRATEQLLNCLVGIGYARYARGRYAMPRRLRKWLVRGSRTSLVDKLVFQIFEWDYMQKLDEFVRTGRPIDLHAVASPEEWRAYQDGMRDLSAGRSREVARKLPVPPGATRLLDIGGSHGLYSIELCKRHPKLRATILERPGAIDRASQIAAREGLGDRVAHRSGNALTDELGDDWDVVFISNVVHHFTARENRRLAERVHRALRPRGLYVVGELLRASAPGDGGAVAATSDLYFALTSASGCWSAAEIGSWMSAAGFKVRRPIKYLVPGYQTILGRK